MLANFGQVWCLPNAKCHLQNALRTGGFPLVEMFFQFNGPTISSSIHLEQLGVQGDWLQLLVLTQALVREGNTQNGPLTSASSNLRYFPGLSLKQQNNRTGPSNYCTKRGISVFVAPWWFGLKEGERQARRSQGRGLVDKQRSNKFA